MKEKKIYLLLTDTGTNLTKIIKAYTKAPYNHASIAFDKDLNEVYSFGRKAVNNPFIGGFVKEDVRNGIFQYADCAVYCLTVTDSQWQKMKCYIERIKAEEQMYRYNFIGLFGVMLEKPIKRKHAFFCSQFVATVLREGDIFNYHKEFSLVKPNELPLFGDFQLVYEGRLKDYWCTEKIARHSKQAVAI